MPSTKRNRKRREKAQRRSVKFLTIIGCLAGAFCLAVVLACVVGATWLTNIPDYTHINTYANTGITTIYASDRETVLARLYLENRIEISRDEVSSYVLEGTVATEDERFYEHGGIDPIGIARALFVNASSGGASEGASTITQQLVRNTVLLDEMADRTIKRKVREMYVASQIERQFSKDDLLMMYINVVNYGDGCYGIEAASRDYFGKHASELTLSEAALLIGIPQSPTANNPREHMDNALSRRAIVLQRMLSNNYITQAEYDAALADTPVIIPRNTTDDSISNIAPYFVDFVKNDLNDATRYPAAKIAHGGLSVYTTLDANLQNDANKAIQDNLKYMETGLDAALASVDPNSGKIVAMVGGRDYTQDQFNLAAQMKRQAGSSFKTFTLLAALNEGMDPDNTYIDSTGPIVIGTTWNVGNSEGHGGGSMSLTSATVSSVNTVFARLVHALGYNKAIEMAHACGITSDLVEDDTVTLGTSGVNPLEMAAAYATIANGGTYHAPYAVSDIVDSSGDTIYQHAPALGKRVISAAVAQKATEILEKVVSYGTGTAAQLSNGQPCAGKTGTSEHGRDLWFCGFTPQYSTAVWAGFRAEKETYLYGGSICAPIWRQFMNAALEGKNIVEFPTTEEKINYKPSKTWDFDKGIDVIGGEYDDESSSSSSSTSSSSSSSSSKSKSSSSSKSSSTPKPEPKPEPKPDPTPEPTPEPTPTPAPEPTPEPTPTPTPEPAPEPAAEKTAD